MMEWSRIWGRVKKLRVVVVHPYMHIMGGGERVCLQIVRSLLEDGHDVTLVSEPVDQDDLIEVSGSSLLKDVKRVPYKPFEPKVKKFSVYQRVLHHMIMTAGRKVAEADLEILTQDVMFTCDVGAKKVAYVHYPEYLVHLEGAKSASRLFWRAYYAPVIWYWHRQIRKIDLFLCNSQYTRRAIKEKWGKDATVIYPPVDVEKIRPAPKEEFVATVGRFVKEKNYELVLEVAKLMPEVKFLIMGRKQDENYYEKIKNSKPSNVELLTDLSSEDLFSILGKAKVYLHTMIGEHFGISIVEAMAAGCIPVVHNSGGMREAIGDFGYVYSNIKECCDCISRALHKKVEISRITEYAKRFSSKNFREKIKKVLKERENF